MQSNISLTIETGVTSVYVYRHTDGAGLQTWTKDHASGVPANASVLTKQTSKTRNGILSRALKISVPIIDGVTGKITGSIQGRFVLNSPATTPVSDHEIVMNEMSTLLMSAASETAVTTVSQQALMVDYVSGY